MAMRWGPGPVFFFEFLTTSRRWQTYAARSVFVLLLLAALLVVWLSQPIRSGGLSRQDLARIGEGFFYGMIGTELALVLLAAPAFTAGAICLDKTRGALAHLMVTELSSAEIVLGKLASRLVPVLGLVACSLPVLTLTFFLGGMDPGAVLGAYLVVAGVAVFGCALALTLSVWGKKTHEVLLLNYILWAALLLAWPAAASIDWGLTRGSNLPDWVAATNPFWLVFAPYAYPGKTSLLEPAVFLAVCLALAALLTLVAIWRIRPVTLYQASRPERAPRSRTWLRVPLRWWPFGASLDRNPVLWREWHRRRPSRWMTFVWVVFAVVALVFSGMAVFLDGGSGRGELAPFVTALQASVGLLLLSITAGTSLSEERSRGSLDVLLTTPLPTAAIVWGKWWGTYRATLVLTLLPTLTAAALAVYTGNFANVLLIAALMLSYGAAVTSLGLALATWFGRVNRAMTISVVLYVLVTVGWMFAAIGLGHSEFSEGIAEASPFYGVGLLTHLARNNGGPDRVAALGFALFWVVAYLAVAGVLLAATLQTFDRCLGRVAQQPWRRPRLPLRRLIDEAPREVLPVRDE